MTVLSGPRLPLPEGATVVSLVEAQVDATPGAVAVHHAREALRFRELEARANRLAQRLIERGVGPDVPVGVYAGRSPELVVALLGILKAGGACLPLDPSYPTRRLAFMVGDAHPPVVVVQEGLDEQLPVAPNRLVAVGGHRPGRGSPPARPTSRVGPDDLAYVLYTSGSTGEPKGVALPHRGLVNHNLAVADLYELGPDDRVAQFCSISFDVSIEEIFPTWQTGGTVVLRPDELPTLGPAWLQWLRERSITVLNLPTAYWHEWVRDLDRRGAVVPECVRLVVVGGERALGSVYRTWLRVGGDRVRWVNAYGPAETSVLATAWAPPPGAPLPEDRDPPIGKPLANTWVRVLDEDGRPVPVGSPGDLHIGGLGVGRGYLHRPDLTAASFLDDVPDEEGGGRAYRTGDLVRQLPDGNLAFDGRRDEQVKIRGFRIEPTEVEAAVARHPAVAEAAVVAREERPGEKRLVAYLVTAPPRSPGEARARPPSTGDLREFLGDRLPPFMLPSAFVSMDALPKTPNGKVDRRALPAPEQDPHRDLGTARVAPRTPTEQTIAEIWSRVLGVDQVGIDDDLFDLGGHSLLATQIVAEVRQALGVEIGVGELLEAPTVADLATAVSARRRGGERPPPLVPVLDRRDVRIPLTLSQEQMWVLEKGADPPGLFNITAQHWFSDPVDPTTLRQALAHVVERHETLRTGFGTGPDGPHQAVRPEVAVELPVTDLPGASGDVREAELRRRVADQDAAAFDVGEPGLFRARLYRLTDTRSMVATTFDHLVCDGTSAYIFLSELTAVYEALADGRAPSLRPLSVGYGDYALWQRSWLTDERLASQLEYWKDKLAGMPRGPAVAFDRIPDVPSRQIALRPVEIAPEAYARLERLARATRSTTFAVTVAAVQSLLARVGGREDIVLSTTLSGRQRSELEGLIGCFHGVGRIRTDLSGDPSFEQVVARTTETVLGLFEHQDIPFMRVRRAVLPDFPEGGLELLKAVPIELQYFHTAHDEWAPGRGVVERPGPDRGPDELFFRGHLHPLKISLLDDGTRLWGELSYKTGFYDEKTVEVLAEGLQALIRVVTDDPSIRLSELAVAGAVR